MHGALKLAVSLVAVTEFNSLYAFQSTLVYLTVSDDIYKDVCRKIVPVVQLGN